MGAHAKSLVEGVPATRHPLYMTWYGLQRRCLNPSDPAFPNYGGRGITVCARWLESFEAFAADMGTKPTADHSIDRVDVNGNYEPSNCRWASVAEQAANRRPRHYVSAAPFRITCSAHVSLRDILADVTSDWTKARLGAVLGLSGASVSNWLTGKSRPDHHFRIALERLLGIPAVDWMTPDEHAIAFGSPATPTEA